MSFSALPLFAMGLSELEALCVDALASVDQNCREDATNKLRFLSHFDQWHFLQDTVRSTRSPHALFVCCKAMTFIVSNEIGPSERTEVQAFVLRYLTECCAPGVERPPKFVLRALLAVYATALYFNWRMTVITMEDEDVGSVIGRRIQEQLSQSLPADLALVGMLEVLNHFSKEDGRLVLLTVRNAFATRVLPHFFGFAVTHLLSSFPADALQLAIACLDFVPPVSARPLVTVRLTTDETLFIAPLSEWLPPLYRLFACAVDWLNAGAIGGDPLADHQVEECLRCCVAAATVDIPVNSAESDTAAAAYARMIFDGAECLLALFSKRGNPAVLQETARMMVACIERLTPHCNALLLARPWLLATLRSTADLVSLRWAEGEEGARSQLLSLLGCLSTHYLPELQRKARQHGYQADAELQLQQARSLVLDAFEGYFEGVLAHCYVTEGSREAGLSESMQLHAENHLRPVARMIVVFMASLGPVLREALRQTSQYHDWCLQLKSRALMSEDALMALAVLCSRSLGEGEESALALASSPAEMAALTTKLVLSRMSVLVQIAALTLRERALLTAMMEDTVGDVELLGEVVRIINSFLTEDLADEFLAMSVFGDDSPAKSAGAAVAQEAESHVVILRSIVFFAEQLRQSAFALQDSVLHMSIEATALVFLRHSHHAVLVGDAVPVFLALLSDSDCSLRMLQSATCDRILRAHADNKLWLTSSNPDDVLSLSHAQLKARGQLVKALAIAAFGGDSVASAHGARHPNARIKEHLARLTNFLVAVTSAGEANHGAFPRAATVFWRDFRGIVKGVEVPSSCRVVLAWLLEHVGALARYFLHGSPCVAEAVKTLRAFAGCCEKHLSEDLGNPEQPELCGWVLDQVLAALQPFNVVGNSNNTQQPLPTQLLCDIAGVLHSVFSGHWCNVGVMVYYGDRRAEDAMIFALRALACIDVNEIMYLLKGREMLFRGIRSALDFRFASRDFELELYRSGAWEALAVFLHKCLAHSPLPSILQCLVVLFREKDSGRPVSPDLAEAIFKEIAVLLSTGTFPEDAIEACCTLLELCHHAAPARCEGILEHLLNVSSAYHRVRLRCLLMLMRNPPPDLCKSFVTVFGISGGTRHAPTLSAW